MVYVLTFTAVWPRNAARMWSGTPVAAIRLVAECRTSCGRVRGTPASPDVVQSWDRGGGGGPAGRRLARQARATTRCTPDAGREGHPAAVRRCAVTVMVHGHPAHAPYAP